ncbi:GntR family transcriptional regulator [Paenibacillus roseipurpureus]|uniref:GntR family transcriptional regulator n=1 Tax=Paenibacillus roseopurpureus TaxID=2918901 RepID=A0AA96LQC1_9BACL|nr:GntR family transcriptional regulator [Paenibacillus sp. MBLB1832]WNR46050.1 GntR family transcriptional regulator [Paenibacillus sp. MBLB1832]
MLVGKLEKQPMRQEVYNSLLSGIVSGELEPGKQLDEKELSERLGVSRTPIREAINRLAQEGIVTEIPYRGNFVRQFSPKEVRDLYEVRKSLEVMAIRLAIAYMTEEEAAEISELVHLSATAAKDNDLSSYSKYDTQFHDKLLKCSRNEILYHIMSSMNTQILIIRQMANKNDAVVRRAQFERESIEFAIRTRNADVAAKFMEEHIDNVMKDVISRLPE